MPSVVIPPRDVSPNTGTGGAVLAVSPSLNGPITIGGTTTTGLTDLLVNPTTKTTGNLLDLQVNGTSKFKVTNSGAVTVLSVASTGNLELQPNGTGVKLFGGLLANILFTTTSSYFNTGIPSLSTGSGAVVVNGGVGISGNIFIGAKINAANLPTSSAGLSAGDLWVDTTAGNVVKRI